MIPGNGSAALSIYAFHLPQFHRIPENDKFWGPGFTEWTNVQRARPLFKGHEQPKVPYSRGYYDLSDGKTLAKQFAMAKRYGISGFCFYHYWFQGKLVLESPLHQLLVDRSLEVPYFLCWANESWSRRWDGRESEILIQQDYSEEDDAAHFAYFLRHFHDPRYISRHGEPVLLVYRGSQLPNAIATTRLWRKMAIDAGLPGLRLGRVESFADESGDPRDTGFDFSVEFRPGELRTIRHTGTLDAVVALLLRGYSRVRNNFPSKRRPWRMPYDHLVRISVRQRSTQFERWPCVVPSWDNTPRRGGEGIVFHSSTPKEFASWLADAASRGRRDATESPTVMINAWNEWGEGAYLEPDERWGDAYLDAVRRVVRGGANGPFR